MEAPRMTTIVFIGEDHLLAVNEVCKVGQLSIGINSKVDAFHSLPTDFASFRSPPKQRKKVAEQIKEL